MPFSYVNKAEAGIEEDSRKKIIDRTLDQIYQRRGTITPALLLEEARNPRSEVHGFFEWDDRVAADKHRLRQATDMILASKFVAVLQSARNSRTPSADAIAAAPTVRRFLPALRGEGFRLRTEVLSDADRRKEIVKRKKAVLRSWCREVVDIDELQTLRKLILDEIGEGES